MSEERCDTCGKWECRCAEQMVREMSKPKSVQREALPNKSDIFAVLEIALARARRADANLDISIKELDRARRMYDVWSLLKEK